MGGRRDGGEMRERVELRRCALGDPISECSTTLDAQRRLCLRRGASGEWGAAQQKQLKKCSSNFIPVGLDMHYLRLQVPINLLWFLQSLDWAPIRLPSNRDAVGATSIPPFHRLQPRFETAPATRASKLGTAGLNKRESIGGVRCSPCSPTPPLNRSLSRLRVGPHARSATRHVQLPAGPAAQSHPPATHHPGGSLHRS